ncbi:hypothetical protein KKC45_02290 [Patescibacteria group bacterium]|nr:hypothetical protein [Patescibacteria group bacterium]
MSVLKKKGYLVRYLNRVNARFVKKTGFVMRSLQMFCQIIQEKIVGVPLRIIQGVIIRIFFNTFSQNKKGEKMITLGWIMVFVLALFFPRCAFAGVAGVSAGWPGLLVTVLMLVGMVIDCECL